ncbi:MAG: GxxExxY protein [Bacteroidales bacterium]|jgi:GxxExxY protein|nr:GxxExxY protein [Bacteroidales bacterium]MBR3571796.1 GxxExxY protein [Bacteroidales bacterium]
MNENEISKIIVDAAIKVHSFFGPGLLEKTYQECLFYELISRGLRVEKEKSLPIVYQDLVIEHAFRIDLLVEQKVVIETKSVAALAGIHLAQTLTYLKLGNYKLGLLLNFNVEKMINGGIKRVICGDL